MKKIRVAHIETGLKLYGGAYQVMLLLQSLPEFEIENELICVEGSDIEKAALSLGIPTHTLKSAGDLDFSMISPIKKILRKSSIDVVHLHSRRGADVMGAIAAKWAGIPTVLSRRVDNPESRFAPFKYKLYDQVITISEAIKSVLIQAGVPEHNIQCVRSSLDAKRFDLPVNHARWEQLLGTKAKHRKIAMLAQLIPRKGHALLIDAAHEIRQKHPDTVFVLFGKGALLESLQQDINRQGLQESFFLPGFIQNIEELLPGCYVVAHPAYREGLGISLLQAQAAGVPVVTSATGGMLEVIAEPCTGFFIEPGNHQQLATQLIKLLDDTALRERMGQKAKDWVNATFSVKKMAQGNAEVYQKIINPDKPKTEK